MSGNAAPTSVECSLKLGLRSADVIEVAAKVYSSLYGFERVRKWLLAFSHPGSLYKAAKFNQTHRYDMHDFKRVFAVDFKAFNALRQNQ